MIEVNHNKIKETNRKKIIKLLLEKDEITKLDISRELDISITTVSTNISELKKIGIVEDNINSYLSSTQLGITLVGLLLGWLGEPTVSKLIDPLLEMIASNAALKQSISFIVSFSLITLLEVVFGELVPKAIALYETEKCNLLLDGSLILFHKLTYPITMTFDKLTELCLKPFGIEPAN